AIDVAQGQRISAEVEGIRLGRSLFDSRLSITDTNGSIFVTADDTWLALQDPFASVVAPSNGTYLIQIREVTYGGNDNCHYRLHIGSCVRPSSVFPLGGRSGEPTMLTFFSEAGEFTQQVALPNLPQDK